MKRLYISDVISNIEEGKEVEILGWIKSKRDSGSIIFFDVTDSSGNIQVIVDKDKIPKSMFSSLKKLPVESSVKITGKIKLKSKNVKEIKATDFKVIGLAKLNIFPNPRRDFNIFDPKYADYVLKNRHLYLRNEKMKAVFKIKNNLLFEIHKWFNKNGFVFVDAPVLTELLLYDDKSAFKLDYDVSKKPKQEVFLSQCNMFQLEAAIHAFEKVYNLSPSFRAEHSKTNRHLREYWHLKAEVAWANLNDLLKISERMLYNITKNVAEKSEDELKLLNQKIDLDNIKPPYKKITYDEAVEILHSKKINFEWGKSLGQDEEKALTKEFGEKLLFVKGIPCSAEAFPFSRDKKNPQITRTCDLISPYGFGEILGTAEKISNKKELLERMSEKGKNTPEQMKRYKWYIDLREYGCVPHGGIGMGVERLLRFLLKLPHVRDVVSFPRIYGRYPNP